MPNTRCVKFDVPKDCKLRKYSEQLVYIFKNKDYKEDFNNFSDQLFHDSFAFVKKELKTDKHPVIVVEFVYTQTEYERLEKQVNQFVYQREKPKIKTLGFTITSNFSNKIYINFEPLFGLIEKNCSAFVFNLVSTLIHEILHCFYRDLKDEQATYDLHCKMLEVFLGITLPDEMKETKASDYYTSKMQKLNSLGDDFSNRQT